MSMHSWFGVRRGRRDRGVRDRETETERGLGKNEGLLKPKKEGKKRMSGIRQTDSQANRLTGRELVVDRGKNHSSNYLVVLLNSKN